MAPTIGRLALDNGFHGSIPEDWVALPPQNIQSGVKKIRVHDLRHSHASLLIEMGCQPLLIADRLGHEKIQTTLNTYSHLYPNKQAEVAAQLENVINGTTVPNGSQMAGVANL